MIFIKIYKKKICKIIKKITLELRMLKETLIINYWIAVLINKYNFLTIYMYFFLEFLWISLFKTSITMNIIKYLYSLINIKNSSIFIKENLIIIFDNYLFFLIFFLLINFFLKILSIFLKYYYPKFYIQLNLNIFFISLIINKWGYLDYNYIYNVLTFKHTIINKLNIEYFYDKIKFQEYKLIFKILFNHLAILDNNYQKLKTYDKENRQLIHTKMLFLKNVINNFNDIFLDGFLSKNIFLNKNNEFKFLQKYQIIEKIEDFFDKSYELKKNKLLIKKLLKNFILNWNFIIIKINLDKNIKNNINILLYKYNNITLNDFNNKENLNYINISILKNNFQKLLFDKNLLISKDLNFINQKKNYILILKYLNHNLNILIHFHKILTKLNKNNLIIEYFFIGIDYLIQSELTNFNFKNNNNLIINNNNKLNFNLYNLFLDYLVSSYISILKFLNSYFDKINNLLNYIKKTKIYKFLFFFYKINLKLIIVKIKKLFNNKI